VRTFRSPNSGQTALTLQHMTSPASGYKPPAGHNADGYTMAQRVGMKKGGWIQDVKLKESVHRLQKKVALEEQKR